ncbi:MAG: hypothetical protein KDK62_04125 [Chlamydiia bacterium]|nr:hypothetical protein [Chlamydiia bacterium]
MNKSLPFLALAAALCTGPLFADNYGGKFRVTGEYLYLKPSVESNYFVQVSDEEPGQFAVSGRQIQDQFNYASGYRAEVGYTFCGLGEVSLGYTHLTDSTSKQIEGEFLTPTLGDDLFDQNYAYYPGTATSHLDVRYKSWGAYYTLPVCAPSCCDFSLVFGLEYVDIKFKQLAEFVDSSSEENLTGQVALTSKTRGMGPIAGLKIACPVFSFGCDCSHVITFRGYASAGLFVTRNIGKASAVDIDNSTGEIDRLYVDLSRKRSSDMTPALFARFGLSYDYCFKCIDTRWEIGYQLASYYNAVMRTHMPQSASASSFSFHRYNNFNLQGLYISGSLMY